MTSDDQKLINYIAHFYGFFGGEGDPPNDDVLKKHIDAVRRGKRIAGQDELNETIALALKSYPKDPIGAQRIDKKTGKVAYSSKQATAEIARGCEAPFGLTDHGKAALRQALSNELKERRAKLH
jgi:hypothetical protein